jgi:hypothetical protein
MCNLVLIIPIRMAESYAKVRGAKKKAPNCEESKGESESHRCYAGLFLNFPLISFSKLLAATGCVARLVVSPAQLPYVNCQSYSRFPSLRGFVSTVVSEVQSSYGSFSSSRPVLSAWLNRFHPGNLMISKFSMS